MKTEELMRILHTRRHDYVVQRMCGALVTDATTASTMGLTLIDTPGRTNERSGDIYPSKLEGKVKRDDFKYRSHKANVYLLKIDAVGCCAVPCQLHRGSRSLSSSSQKE